MQEHTELIHGREKLMKVLLEPTYAFGTLENKNKVTTARLTNTHRQTCGVAVEIS